ncbi:MAG: hypothetical protein NVS3B28_22250 [Candidatus Velthaea sp.]
MAVVYQAFDTVLERRVAIKYFQTHLMNTPVLVERFRREALAAAKIDHANVVAIHDIGEGEGGRPFIVMEFVDGPTIGKLLEDGPLSAERTATIGAGIAYGLGAAHALGFVHRDVKPANVLVAAADVAKLTDFGLVRSDAEDAPEGLAARLTAVGNFVGTVRYVAPEHAESGHWSAASDCFALGATLYQMVTGEFPLAGARPEGIDPELGGIIEALLVSDPDGREADAVATGDELAAVAERLQGERIGAEPPPG